MSQNIFYSSLSPNEIRIRLSIYAKAANFGWSYSTAGFYYRFYSDDQFFLIRTRETKLGPTAKNQRVFNAKMAQEEAGTRIEGDFGVIKKDKGMIWFVAIFSVLAVLIVGNILPILLFVPFALFMPRFLLSIVSSRYQEEEKAVLTFIEEKLLH